MSTTAPEPKSRRACEACRRKKTKCPGERPTCSFCRRLNQACSYGERKLTTSGINKTTDSSLMQGCPTDRIHALETHIEQIYGLLRMIDDVPVASSYSTDTPPSHTSVNPTSTPMRVLEGEIVENFSDFVYRRLLPDTQMVEAPIQRNSSSHLGDEAVREAMEIYMSQIHGQPLLLFSTNELSSSSHKWPFYLRRSFVALTVRLSSTHPEQDDHQSLFFQARRQVMTRLAMNDRSLAILQSLCLLAFGSIICGDKINAWTDIGVAARLAIATHAATPNYQSEEWSRAYWTLYALDHTYGASFSMVRAFSSKLSSPAYPRSSPPPSQVSQETYVTSMSEVTSTFGIDTFFLQLLTIWGHTIDFVRKIKDNEVVQVWLETGSYSGPYHKIMSEIYDIEMRAGESHRLRHTGLIERSSAELKANRSYWAPWMAMQVLIHAVQASIHHPFLHIIKGQNDKTRGPPSFLQHMVDQALLHSSWIAKFINFCAEKDFKIYDPFIAHLVSIAATALMFFLDANDSSLAQQASYGYKTCYEFVQDLSMHWPHLRNTLHKLDALHKCKTDQFAPGASVQGSLLWSLFDYSSSTTPIMAQSHSEPTVELNVNTQFLSPLNSMPADGSEPLSSHDCHSSPSGGTNTAQFLCVDMETNSFDQSFDLFNPDWLNELNTHSLGDGFWSDFGQH
ncbi:hypothetical protein ACN47E_002347 [Coniothyrium glycines]